jgi:RNA polymerase sigma factor (sigma-70 family)
MYPAGCGRLGRPQGFPDPIRQIRAGPLRHMRAPDAGPGPGAGRVSRSNDARIWRKAHLFDASKGNALAWMAVVTRNCALSYRAAVPLPSPSLEEAGAQTAVEARPSGDQVITSDLRQCLKKLNDKYRKCVTLIYLHGLSYAELATQMDAPLGSVKSWVHRAVRELALCMGNDVRGS